MIRSSKALDNFKQRSIPETGLRVRMYWGDILYDTSIFSPKDTITVGKRSQNSFIADLDQTFPSEQWEMIRFKKDGTAELTFTPSIAGHIRRGKQITSLRNLSENSTAALQRYPFTQEDEIDVSFGFLSFYVDWVHYRHPIARSKPIETPSGALLLGSICLLALLMVFVHDKLPPASQIAPPADRIVKILPYEAPRPPAPAVVKPPPVPAPVAAPKKIVTPANAAPKKKAAPVQRFKAPPAPPKALDTAAQLRDTNLGSLVSGLSSLQATAPGSRRANSDDALAAVPSASGSTGFSSDSLRRGADSRAEGIGQTSGQGQGSFEGTGKIAIGGDSQLASSTGLARGGNGSDGAGLDRNVIDSVVKRRQERVRLCYERQLNSSPGLAGKITVAFMIGKWGQVVSARITEDSLKNETVNHCVLAEIKSWSFPKPQAGRVSVEYPFSFESTGNSQ